MSQGSLKILTAFVRVWHADTVFSPPLFRIASSAFAIGLKAACLNPLSTIPPAALTAKSSFSRASSSTTVHFAFFLLLGRSDVGSGAEAEAAFAAVAARPIAPVNVGGKEVDGGRMNTGKRICIDICSRKLRRNFRRPTEQTAKFSGRFSKS